ncbi:phosphonate C-P lyase system protein PhnG [Lysinibacillus sp. PLM2]|nr:phosphonate C-P lyase system protein PhnG [Lysinibacillus sp. PLM2]
MRRALRTKILIEVGHQEAIEMANEIIDKYEVQEILAPRQGLAMIKMRESAKNSLFYIGEVLITEAKVRLGNSYGVGMLMEENNELSRALAVIDAAYKENLPETIKWQEKLNMLEQKLNNKIKEIKCSIERTKVNFETMNS